MREDIFAKRNVRKKKKKLYNREEIQYLYFYIHVLY